ncbi:MAG: sigma-70 family RNA polymerase sigma factor [Aliihoeflea sp.]
MTTQSPQDHARLAARVAVDRDRAAFAALFDHFAPRVNGYLQRLGMERSQAEDLAQEVLAVLWHKAHLFDPSKSSLATWLYRVARNRRIDHLRRDKSDRLDPADPIFEPDAPEPADEALDAARRDERVRLALDTLPPEQIELIRLAFFAGLTHSQIAEKTGVPLGTVKSRIRLAFSRLRKALEADAQVDTDV